MEYMDRGTLEDRVGRAGEARLARDAGGAARRGRGLVYAEAKGIVHRDLKPANLMQNHVGATKIADLGLATHIEAEEHEAAEKKVFGTPHFMSPEQVRGEKVDSRSDLYSLGATAYRLLTGHTPFEGTNAREIVRAHLSLEPRPMRDFVPDLSEPALALVARLMRKDPAERFASAAELLKEIERLRAQGEKPEPGRARPGKLAAAFAVVVVAGALWFANRRGGPAEAPLAAPDSDEALRHPRDGRSRVRRGRGSNSSGLGDAAPADAPRKPRRRQGAPAPRGESCRALRAPGRR
jgi:serine/threonine-protein kinase